MISHKIQLNPTKTQANAFARACGVKRFAYNWALEEWNRQYAAGLKPSGYNVRKAWTAIKRAQFPWVYDSPKDANSIPALDVEAGWKKFFKYCKTKKGPRVSPPKKKKKNKCRDSFYANGSDMQTFGKKVRLPLVGHVKLTESVRFKGRILSATISRQADRWFISFCIENEEKRVRTQNGVAGVDLGLTVFAAVARKDEAGHVALENHLAPKPLKAKLKKVARLQRVVSRRQHGTKLRRESHRHFKARMAFARCHMQIGNIRQDFLHRLSTKLCRENQTVVIEDLAVSNMLKNHSLARNIQDVGWGEFRRQITYKAELYGTKLVVANRWYASTKTCSQCGCKQGVPLNVRTYRCPSCSLEINRDENAALNLLSTAETAGIYARGDCAAGASQEALSTVVEPRNTTSKEEV